MLVTTLSTQAVLFPQTTGEKGRELSLYRFSLLPFTNFPCNSPCKSLSWTVPASVTEWITKGPNQCVHNFPRFFKNFLSYNKTTSPTSKILCLICSSCHALSLTFWTFCLNPAMNRSSSSSSNYDIRSASATESSISVNAAILKLGNTNSIGTTASCPYTILNGVCPVNFLHFINATIAELT